MELAKTDKKSKRKITEVLGIDLGSTSIKVVRIKKSGNSFSLIEADVMESIDWQAEGDIRLNLDKKLNTPYVAICYAGIDSVIRFLDFPAKLSGRVMDNRLRKQLGVNGDYRLAFCVAQEGTGGDDNKVIAVSIPAVDTEKIKRLLPGTRPTLVSIEVSGLSALHTFEHTDLVRNVEEAVCYIECGAEVTVVSFFHKGRIVLTRKFEYGGSELVSRIRELLNIDQDAALSTIFDDPQPLNVTNENPMGPFLKQLTISRHYVERSEQCRIGKIYASGGLSYSPYWVEQIGRTMDTEVEVWNPFTANGVSTYPRGVKGVESMFAPALGAALAIMS
ncbi:MAG: pilus assembly protein PilM [Verrucomicrobiota bacterium]